MNRLGRSVLTVLDATISFAGMRSARREELPMKKCARYLAVLCFSLLLSVLATRAQTIVSGEITGTVTDASGAVIPAATVTLSSSDTGFSSDADDRGHRHISILSSQTGKLYAHRCGPAVRHLQSERRSSDRPGNRDCSPIGTRCSYRDRRGHYRRAADSNRQCQSFNYGEQRKWLTPSRTPDRTSRTWR